MQQPRVRIRALALMILKMLFTVRLGSLPTSLTLPVVLDLLFLSHHRTSPDPFPLAVGSIPNTLLVPNLNTNTSLIGQDGVLDIEAEKRPRILKALMLLGTDAIRRGNIT